jgi:hypothetical protein
VPSSSPAEVEALADAVMREIDRAVQELDALHAVGPWHRRRGVLIHFTGRVGDLVSAAVTREITQ